MNKEVIKKKAGEKPTMREMMAMALHKFKAAKDRKPKIVAS